MRWNCPHCSETVSIGIDIEQVKRAYVRCGACKGVALLQTKTAYADHEAAKLADIQMRERQLEIQAAQLQAAQAEQALRMQQVEIDRARAIETAEKSARAAAIAEAQNAAQLAADRAVQAVALATPPPFNPTPAAMRAIQSNALDIAREIDLEIENTIRTLATLDRNGGNRRILRETTLSAGDIALETEAEMQMEISEETTPAVIEDTIITVTELETANEASAFEEPVVATPKSAAALTDQAAAIANFDRSNPAIQIPGAGTAAANSPQPPAFLMRKETLIPMPIQFATNDANPTPAPSEPNQKLLKLAVIVATIVAIVSGLYLFTQGQKLMQSASIIEPSRQ